MTYPTPPLVCGKAAFLHPLSPVPDNAFNPCFLTAIIWLFAVLYGAFATISLHKTNSSPRYGDLSPKSTGLLHWLRCGLVFLHNIIWLVLFGTISIVERYADHKLLPFGSLTFVSLAIFTPLHIIEPLHLPVALPILLSFWPLVAIIEFVLFFQDKFSAWPVLLHPAAPMLEFSAFWLSIFIFVLEYKAWKPSYQLVLHYRSSGSLNHLLDEPNFIDKITFLWMNALITNSYKNQTLDADDLPRIKGFTTEESSRSLRRYWNDPTKRKSKNRLLVSLVRAFGSSSLACIFYETGDSLLGFVQPQLLKLLIVFIGDRISDPANNPVLKGALISVGMFAITIVQTAMSNQYMIRVLEVGLGSRSSLTSLVYEKSMRLSNRSRSNRTTGDIVNLISVDAVRVQVCAQEMGTLIVAPTELFVCIYSLWKLLGLSSLAGVVTIIIMIPINTIIVRYLKKLNKVQMKLKDHRNSITNEILVSIKSLKLYSWELPMLDRLLDARNNKELRNLKRIRVLNQAGNLIWTTLPFMITMVTFTAFLIFDKSPLTPEIVFPALSLLNILSRPILSFPTLINYLTEADVALGRISDFLNEDEVDQNLLSITEDDDGTGLKLELISFLWSKAPDGCDRISEEMDYPTLKYALKDINIDARKGDFVCVVGKVGSGKSSLLSSIIGQLDAIDAREPLSKPKPIQIGGSTAFCSQNPWIMNASVRENILFGHRYDEDYYNKTVDACQLLPDLEVLPDGDATQVGEKGITLSGGQKARVSLARAVYARCDVYLLDDVLSAVDSHVGKKIVTNVLSGTGLLGGKTILLATNNIGVLQNSDQIYLLENGTITESGTYANASNGKDLPKLNQLLHESGNIGRDSVAARGTDPDSEVTSSLAKNSDRKASVATFDWDPFKKNLKDRTRPVAETSAKGKVKWKVYWQYIQACSLAWTIFWLFVNLAATLASVMSNFSLKKWADRNELNGNNSEAFRYIAIYSVLGVSTSVLNLAKGVIFWVHLGIRGGRVVHERMAVRLMKAPMSFFERTPVGRIMNRFSNDINKVDDALPRSFNGFMAMALKTAMTFVVVGVAIPSFLVVAFGLTFVYGYYQKYYISVQRELKRLVSLSISPIFAHFQESLTGVESIRAYHQEERFSYINKANVDFNMKSLFMLRSINRWLSVRLQFIGSIVIWTSSSMLIYSTTGSNPVGAGMAGFVMSYALQVTSSMRMMVRMSAEVEANIVSVERCFEYCELPMEEDEHAKCLQLPVGWPNRGEVELTNFSTRYAQELDYVLQNVSVAIKSGEKVGVVGRTGAGKSSLVLALFRMLKAEGGSITIDGLDISQLKLFDLRHNLSIIPQDAHMFEGTIRENLDPFGEHTEDELWHALELCSLKAFVEGIDEGLGLESKVSETGSNFSAGQRQLICLGRTLLSPSKILVLDEATAAVDIQTDKIIQRVIREEFKDKTIITIAHRLDTVMDSDRILALDRGQVSEFDTPANLLQNEKSIFYNLCKQGSYI